jgi:hypothetical protein
MDFINAGCKLIHLHKDEITHELTIRKLPVNPLSRRTSLCQALKETDKLARKGSLQFTEVVNSDADSELVVCQRKANDIDRESQGELSAAAVDRLVSRCKYLLCRLSRLEENVETVDLLKTFIQSMMTRLQEDISSPSDSDTDQNSVVGKSPVVREIIYKSDKTFNINSLNLKFKGDTCVRAFLLRLEELRIARKVTEDQILRGFPEILEGPALSWFRSNRSKYLTYREVIKALREDFDIPDLDHLLLNEIRSRTQANSETIVFFVSTVLGMFERLNRDLPESEKLDILIRNIRPEYSRDLALHDIQTIEQLKILCKRIELAQVKANKFREPVTPRHSSNPFVTPTRSQETRNNFKPKKHDFTVSSRNFASSVASTSKQCFRCGMTNHSTNLCNKSRDIVCFKCGEKGVRTPVCPNCNPNSKN